MTSSTRPID